MKGIGSRRAFLAGTGALLSGCLNDTSSPRARKKGQARPSIALIVLDTLRWDHISCSEASVRPGTSFTPTVDALAEQGLRFTRAYANAPWTLPSHASLFTGREPHVHKQGHNAVVTDTDELKVKDQYGLPGRCVTMAAALKEYGWQTLGISQNPWVGPLTTQDFGFDHFYCLWDAASLPFPPQKGKDLNLHKVTYACRHFLRSAYDPARPLFLFVNYITCHLPYQPAWRFRNKYVPGFPPEYVLEMTSHNWLPLKLQGKLTAEAVSHLRNLYLAEAAEVDAALGQLCELLNDTDLLDKLLLVVTSDHGECIGHHDFFDHQFNLFEDLLRVPLVIRHPRLRKNVVVKEPVQLTDLFPTFLALIGQDRRVEQLKLSGRPLPLEQDTLASAGKPRRLFFLFRRGSRVLRRLAGTLPPGVLRKLDRDLFGVLSGTHKLIVGGDGQIALYDLAADPTELHNRAHQRKDTTSELLHALRDHLSGAVPFPKVSL